MGQRDAWQALHVSCTKALQELVTDEFKEKPRGAVLDRGQYQDLSSLR